MNQNEIDLVSDVLSSGKGAFEQSNRRYEKLGLKFNPFPKSGTANINSSDHYNGRLVPIDDQVKEKVHDFIRYSLQTNPDSPKDKFLSAIITGNYGSGKTQLLLYVKHFLGLVALNKDYYHNPYVIYIDNPGVKLSELVGAIISEIGEENFKKYLWTKIIDKIKEEEDYRNELDRFSPKGGALFNEKDSDPYSSENTVNYKQFLDTFTKYITAKKRKDFDSSFKGLLIKVIGAEVEDATLSQYFFELISEDYGANKTWDALSSGSIKQLHRKETHIIRYIVKLIKEQGYTDFFILVDEFEDVTEGRLTKAQVDNYIYNLRTLLDEERQWCLMFSMTGEALRKLKSISPPLADRISSISIILQNLNLEQAKGVVSNYLDMARKDEAKGIEPFEEAGLELLNDRADGNSRLLLRSCFFAVEKATEVLEKNALIGEDFINNNLLLDD